MDIMVIRLNPPPVPDDFTKYHNNISDSRLSLITAKYNYCTSNLGNGRLVFLLIYTTLPTWLLYSFRALLLSRRGKLRFRTMHSHINNSNKPNTLTAPTRIVELIYALRLFMTLQRE